MNIEAQIQSLQKELRIIVQNDTTAPATTVQQWSCRLDEVQNQLNGLNAAVQRVADANLGLVLVAQLLEAAHTEKLDADQVWCLIDPLRERLERAIEEVKLTIQ